MAPILLTWINFSRTLENIRYKVWHETTYTFPNFKLKFGKGKVISSHILLGMLSLIHARIQVNPCKQTWVLGWDELKPAGDIQYM